MDNTEKSFELTIDNFISILNDTSKTTEVNIFADIRGEYSECEYNLDTDECNNIVYFRRCIESKLISKQLADSFGLNEYQIQALKLEVNFPLKMCHKDGNIILLETFEGNLDELYDVDVDEYLPAYYFSFKTFINDIKPISFKITFDNNGKTDNILDYKGGMYSPYNKFGKPVSEKDCILYDLSYDGYYSFSYRVSKHNNIYDLYKRLHDEVDILKFEILESEYDDIQDYIYKENDLKYIEQCAKEEAESLENE